MTREEFDEIMFRTLVAMGDPTYVGNDPSWDAEYEKMKLLSSDAFSDLCKVSANRYKISRGLKCEAGGCLIHRKH